MDPTQDSGSPLGSSERGKEFLHQRIAHYVILERLGEGGMGIVFKAKDTRLDRFVALKVLRPESVADRVRKLRFVQEARSASALNHPNITHIYDIGFENGVDYIAMEYVQGIALDRMLKDKRMHWREVVDYGVQIADALDAAHTAGILHRDLKPANVMVTERKIAKVLDFGLAKLMEPAESRNPDLEITRTEYGPETVHGMTVGTPRYMSPEQASGKKLDARSDIFSLGVLLYQMVTRAFPFDGESTAAIFASILRDEPQPPGLVFNDVPLELERVIMRCLRKDPGRRFQNMLDVKLALQDIKEEPGTITLRTGAVPVAEPPRRRIWPLAAAGAAVVILGVAGVAWWMAKSNRPPAREADLVQLTSDSGISTDPAISADGKLLAFASDRAGDGNLNIWVQQVGGGEPIRLTNHQANDYQPAFSPDGTRIAFRSDRDGGGIYLVSTLGGEERKLADGGRSPRFSPDGKWIAYWSGPEGLALARPGTARLYIVDSAGGPPRDFRPDFATSAWPVWSPDGKYILFTGLKDAGVPSSSGWWVAPIERGSPVQVKGSLRDWLPYAWHGERVLVSEQTDRGAAKLLEVPISSRDWQLTGAPHRLTSGITREDFPSLSSTGRIAFASVTYNVDIYAVAVNANQGKVTGTPQRLTQDVAIDFVPSISADGSRLAFASQRLGSPGIWTKNLQTGKEAPLVRPTDKFPFTSPDGSQVAWADDTAILAMPFTGGAVRRLCDDCKNMCGWSSDGTKILFTDYSSHSYVGVLDLASGQRTVLKHPTVSVFPRAFSPDGRWIAVSAENPVRIMIVPVRSGQPPAESDWIPMTRGGSRDGHPRWSPNGKLLYFTSDRDGLMCIWAQPLDPSTKRPVGEPFPVLHLHGALLRMRPNLAAFSISQAKLAFSLEEQTGNIWMLKNQ